MTTTAPPTDILDPAELILLRHADHRPGAEAVRDDQESLTYSELLDRVCAIASGLSALGVDPEDRVALWLPNSAAFVTVALGCLWLGAAFVPLSTTDPPARIARILDDCEPKLVVSLDGSEALPGNSRWRHTDITAVLAAAGSAPPRAQDPGRDAYLIYTSGTTGMPKGVRIPASAFAWAISTGTRMMGLDAATRALSVSAFHFDGSYGNLFPPLVAGGSIFIPKREQLIFVKRFYSAVLEEGITHTGFSPSYLRLVLSSPKLPNLGHSDLRTLSLGGEECVARDLAHIWGVLPDLRVFNYYGPTESTIEVTTYEVERDCLETGEVPLGVPHAGVSFHLVRPDGTTIDGSDETGELYIGGQQLMKGYWGDDSLTAAVLRDDVVPGDVLYKTGDLVRRDRRGRYMYVGRCDDVVKRRGVRTSLGEIGRVLRGVEGVTGAVCLAIEIGGALGLAAFVEAGLDITVPKLLEAGSAQLPATMLPDEIFIVRSLPMTSSGKVDRAALLQAAGRKAWRAE